MENTAGDTPFVAWMRNAFGSPVRAIDNKTGKVIAEIKPVALTQ